MNVLLNRGPIYFMYSQTFCHQSWTVANQLATCHDYSSMIISHSVAYRSWPSRVVSGCIHINFHPVFRGRFPSPINSIFSSETSLEHLQCNPERELVKHIIVSHIIEKIYIDINNMRWFSIIISKNYIVPSVHMDQAIIKIFSRSL